MLRTLGHVRFAPFTGAVLGLDLGLALRLAETLGYDVAAVAELLPEAEAGLLEGLTRLRSDGDVERES